jgi:hypothetical protein
MFLTGIAKAKARAIRVEYLVLDQVAGIYEALWASKEACIEAVDRFCLL